MNEQKEFFNRVADSWDQICHHDMKKVENILDLAGIEEGSRVLDVGTGTGVLVPSLVRRVSKSGKVKAVDVAERMIEVAEEKHRFENVVFSCEDALNKVEDEPCYDRVICYSMFPHFENKKQAIERLAEKMKFGGKLVICHSQSREAINRLHKQVDEAVEDDNLPAMDTLRKHFADAGLTVKDEVDDQEMFVIIGERNR